MRLLLSAAALLMGASTAAAQIPPRKTADRGTGASLLLVATPYVAGATSSDPAVKVGAALRVRLARAAGRRYDVISRESMNTAIRQFGYDPDALLDPVNVGALAAALRAQTVVQSVMEQLDDGRVKVTAKLEGNGKSLEASATQETGQSLEAVGAALADALQPAIR